MSCPTYQHVMFVIGIPTIGIQLFVTGDQLNNNTLPSAFNLIFIKIKLYTNTLRANLTNFICHLLELYLLNPYSLMQARSYGLFLMLASRMPPVKIL